MSYNVFKPTPQKKGGVTVSFKKWGISFSRKTSATYFSDSPHAELYFDEEKQKVAIKPLKEKTENSYDVKGDKSKHIKAKDFLEHYKCVHPKASRYIPEWNESLEMLEIKLSNS